MAARATLGTLSASATTLTSSSLNLMQTARAFAAARTPLTAPSPTTRLAAPRSSLVTTTAATELTLLALRLDTRSATIHDLQQRPAPSLRVYAHTRRLRSNFWQFADHPNIEYLPPHPNLSLHAHSSDNSPLSTRNVYTCATLAPLQILFPSFNLARFLPGALRPRTMSDRDDNEAVMRQPGKLVLLRRVLILVRCDR